MNEKIETRVDAGIEFINEYMPNWLEFVNLNNLDIGSPYNCIISQVFKNYDYLEYLLPQTIDRHNLGFTVHALEPEEKEPNYFKNLTEVWKTKIKELKAGKNSPVGVS